MNIKVYVTVSFLFGAIVAIIAMSFVYILIIKREIVEIEQKVDRIYSVINPDMVEVEITLIK
jgi:hypothetical protein